MQNIIKYSNGERSVLSPSEIGTEKLSKTDEKLQLAGDELLRMEDEGGTPLTHQQTAKVSAYAKARKRIKSLLSIKKRHQPDHAPTKE